jgi:hypothetical protein
VLLTALLVTTLACGGGRLIPYSPPTTGAVSDEQLRQGELELRTEGSYLGPV